MIKDLNDIAGKQFGNLTVIRYDHKKKTARIYLCKCNCGNEFYVDRCRLLAGKVKSCGCSHYIKDLNDIVGKVVNKLTVIKYDCIKNRNHYYICKCECGNIVSVRRSDLVNNKVLSCGCEVGKHNPETRIDVDDIIGKKFDRLTVLQYDYHDKKGKDHYYICKCSCGKIISVSRKGLLTRNNKSCGCQKIDAATKHGLAKTKFYKCHTAMKDRCYNPNNKAYSSYGDRGIKVCDRWLGEDGFVHFKEDMYDSYLEHCKIYGEDNTSIDRINVDGDYEPSNCRWATKKEQSNNRRVTVRYEQYNNMTCRDIIDTMQSIVDPSLSFGTIQSRLNSGWSLERALTELPTYHNGQKVVKPISFNEPHYTVPFTFKEQPEIIYPFRDYNKKNKGEEG